ncbi:hypothetical protein BaRGS_00022448 [Batillaria attramentaria]|uniref:Uncharacterized protein n=1 Tax=Batillaria attramentaria TaxID=370345 RepID=A0ABD0KGA6_9CAEN
MVGVSTKGVEKVHDLSESPVTAPRMLLNHQRRRSSRLPPGLIANLWTPLSEDVQMTNHDSSGCGGKLFDTCVSPSVRQVP